MIIRLALFKILFFIIEKKKSFSDALPLSLPLPLPSSVLQTKHGSLNHLAMPLPLPLPVMPIKYGSLNHFTKDFFVIRI